MTRKRKATSRENTPIYTSCKLMKSDDSSDSDDNPLQRHAANARERARMRVLSKAFGKLKTTLPWVPSDTKLSKLDTLRLASSYIAHLRELLQQDNSEIEKKSPNSKVHPINLTWPFASGAHPKQGHSEDTKTTDTSEPVTTDHTSTSPA